MAWIREGLVLLLIDCRGIFPRRLCPYSPIRCFELSRSDFLYQTTRMSWMQWVHHMWDWLSGNFRGRPFQNMIILTITCDGSSAPAKGCISMEKACCKDNVQHKWNTKKHMKCATIIPVCTRKIIKRYEASVFTVS